MEIKKEAQPLVWFYEIIKIAYCVAAYSLYHVIDIPIVCGRFFFVFQWYSLDQKLILILLLWFTSVSAESETAVPVW